MHVFPDVHGRTVRLTFDPSCFDPAPGHVLVVPFYRGQLVMTRHRRRGLELPGGKVEPGETPLEAAVREVREETGGVVEAIARIAQYRVAPTETEPEIVKAVYCAEIARFEPLSPDSETAGYALFAEPPDPHQGGFSDLVRDQVFPLVLDFLRRHAVGWGFGCPRPHIHAEAEDGEAGG
ncbi:MAG: NUDIX domain-containing protein [Calditerricola sp.]|nr:NUDIX domain-containing protein [Calditerricola sp.]